MINDKGTQIFYTDTGPVLAADSEEDLNLMIPMTRVPMKARTWGTPVDRFA